MAKRTSRRTTQETARSGPSFSQQLEQYLTFDRLIIGGSIIATILIVGVILLNSSSTDADPPAIVDPSVPQNYVRYPNAGGQHIDPDTADSLPANAYNSNPPTSGPHFPIPARCRVYDADSSLPDQAYIHSMEHGAVWISYRDLDDQDTIEKLEDIGRRFSNGVIVSYRPENDAKIAVAAWQNLLELDEFDEAQIMNFIALFRNNGPERVPCT
ncbi:MAG: DUF3105 domain-containing protein [Chloroflexi bacterium]|nr:MAG: DUF3105 domain-containing protein [Chloroflexota bacterium]